MSLFKPFYKTLERLDNIGYNDKKLTKHLQKATHYLLTCEKKVMEEFCTQMRFTIRDAYTFLALESLITQYPEQAQQISHYIDSAEYHQHKNNHVLFKNVKRTKGETLQTALQRYLTVCKQLELNLDNYLILKNKTTLAKIRQAEKKYHYKIPPLLENLLIHYGAFNLIGDCYPSSIYLSEITDIKGLANGVIDDWGADLGFAWFEEEWIKYLNSHYFLFGSRYLDDNTRIYYYFSKEGNKIGSTYFDQDDTDSYKHFVGLVFDEIDTFYTLDQLLSQEIDGTIQAIRKGYLK